MPMMHSEKLEDVELCLKEFKRLQKECEAKGHEMAANFAM